MEPGERFRRLIEDGEVADPRFRDPARFPCGVRGCANRAGGWVASVHVPSTLGVRTETDRVYLCDEHLEQVFPGWKRCDPPSMPT